LKIFAKKIAKKGLGIFVYKKKAVMFVGHLGFIPYCVFGG
jgi:hypothetical protein